MADDIRLDSERLISLLQNLGGVLTVEEALHEVIEHIRIFPHQSLAAVVLDDATNELTIKTSRQISYTFAKHFRRPVSGTVVPRVIMRHERVFLNDIGPAHPDYPSLKLEHEFDHVCLVPIIQEQRAVGYLHCDRRGSPPFSDEAARLLLIVGYLVGQQMQRFELVHLTRHLTQVDEASRALKYSTFLEHFRRDMARARAYDTPLSLIQLRLDNYAKYAATAGIAAGHALLAELHAQLTRCARPMDSIGRLSSDAFIVCLGGMNQAELDPLLKRIRDAVHTVREAGLHGDVSACAAGITLQGQPALALPLESILAALGGGLLTLRSRGTDQYQVIAPPTPGPEPAGPAAAP